MKKLVTSLCANYDKEYGCLPLSGPRKVTRLFGERRSSGVSELFVFARKRAIQSLRRRVSAICSVSASPTAHCAGSSVRICCPPSRSCKPCSKRNR
ncbi:hypothetical protein [Cloacibacillus porcorum]|uniref:hypothetical protein n=1 Tax=Cloacibacillus porcorum TaxID=1197717 RepID=UPI003D07A15E